MDKISFYLFIYFFLLSLHPNSCFITNNDTFTPDYHTHRFRGNADVRNEGDE